MTINEAVSVKHTIKEWEQLYNIEILDPDGFDRTDKDLYKRQFTKAEFDKALIYCTIQLK